MSNCTTVKQIDSSITTHTYQKLCLWYHHGWQKIVTVIYDKKEITKLFWQNNNMSNVMDALTLLKQIDIKWMPEQAIREAELYLLEIVVMLVNERFK